MRYLIQAPGQPDSIGDYLDEMECRGVVRRSKLVKDMTTVTVTPIWPQGVKPLQDDVFLALGHLLEWSRKDIVNLPPAEVTQILLECDKSLSGKDCTDVAKYVTAWQLILKLEWAPAH